MSSAAQSIQRPRLTLSRRAGIRLRQWTLRGTAIVYLGAFVALPVLAVVGKGFAGGLTSLKDAFATSGARDALELTLLMALVTAIVNGVFGTMLAFALVRFRFPGRQVINAIVDLPLAIPTLVTGVMLLVLYGPNNPIGRALAGAGIHIPLTQLGILFALLAVTLPFVVRTVQPVLLELDRSEEEAAETLGANGWTTFRKIIFPAIRPAVTAGALLTFARALGEFGSVVVISGNIPHKTLTAPVYIFQLASQFQFDQAAAVASVLFAISFVVVLVTTRLIQARPETDDV